MVISPIVVAALLWCAVHAEARGCFGGMRECAGAAAADDGFVLHMLDASTGGLCLDGTPGGFYLRPGIGADANKFLIENEGGGWCTSTEDCYQRSLTAIGSSRTWPPSGCPGMDGGANGMFSSDCSINPFCNYTMVHLNYCDGASFSGDVEAPVPVPGRPGVQLQYRGRRILDASIAALMPLGLANASLVIWKGCSAGGLSVYLHADYARARMPAATRFVAMPDGGFFMDLPDWTGAPSYTPLYQWVAAAHNVTGSVNAGCVAHYAPLNETWRCFMAQYTLPFITSPLYVTQDLDDIWQMDNIARVGSDCARYPFGAGCTAAQQAYIHKYRYQMLAALEPLMAAAPANGGFLTTCLNHCHQNRQAMWTTEVVAGQALAASFVSWLQGGPLQPLVIDNMLGQNPTCSYGY